MPPESRISPPRPCASTGRLDLRLCFFHLPRIILVGLALLVLSASPGRAEPRFSEEVGSGQLLLLDTVTGRELPALMQDSSVHFAISGMIATVTLEQRFSNDSGDWVEGVYAFPLPDTAAVRRMEMRIGERRVVGEIREREEAKQIYREARSAGRKAGLTEQHRPNLFSNRIANIGPGETVAVRLEYVQAVDYFGGGFSLRFPTTMTARYMPGAPLPDAGEMPASLAIDPVLGWAVPTDQVPDADAISPLLDPREGSDSQPVNPVRISARLDMGMPLARVESAYHEIALARSGGVYDISLARGVSEMDRDFVLSWEPVTGREPRAAVFTEEVDGEHYALLMVVPPAAATDAAGMSRELVFVVDTSGSMGGVSIEQARRALDQALGQLRSGDTFNVVAFDTATRVLHPRPLPATVRNIAEAQAWVSRLDAGGGTEMLPALRAALDMPPAANEDALARLRQIVFITDGAVGNEQALFEVIVRELGDARLYTVGIGSAPNSWFMRKAADYGRGLHTHIGDVSEVATRMSALFEQIASPLARDMRVDWPGDERVDTWPRRVPDLYRGQPLLLAARLPPGHAGGELTVTGSSAGKSWTRKLWLGQAGEGAGPSTAGEAGSAHPGVASLWARRKIEGLLDDRTVGAHETETREAVLQVALAHQLLSPYTSFVAVEEQVSRPAGDGLSAAPVPNTRPRGQSHQGFAYPRTATTGPAKLWLGSLMLFLALMVHVLRRPEADRVLPDER